MAVPTGTCKDNVSLYVSGTAGSLSRGNLSRTGYKTATPATSPTHGMGTAASTCVLERIEECQAIYRCRPCLERSGHVRVQIVRRRQSTNRLSSLQSSGPRRLSPSHSATATDSGQGNLTLDRAAVVAI